MAGFMNQAEIIYDEDAFHFTFAELVATSSTPAIVGHLVCVPKVAKRLLRNLEKAIRMYEADHGEIPEPPRLILPDSQDPLPGMRG